MNYALILAAGVGQRMRNGGLPKQFLKLNGKPIIIYTLEKFDQMEEISKIVISCHGDYLDYMQDLLQFYQIKKVAGYELDWSQNDIVGEVVCDFVYDYFIDEYIDNNFTINPPLVSGY